MDARTCARSSSERRGYDPLFYLPALLQRTVDDPQTTRRFLADYRRTAGELVAANYYGRFRELTLKGGLRGTHPESGGPGVCCWIDALQCEGINDIPMGEFWKRNAEPVGPISCPPQSNCTVKQAACAAHIYGKPVCQAEAYTSFACDWIDDPWSMKDIGDEAFCHGLTRNVLCFWVHQPRLGREAGLPMGARGYALRPEHHLVEHGRRVADLPGPLPAPAASGALSSPISPIFRTRTFPPLSPRATSSSLCRPAGFDYDVLNAEVLLSRAAAKTAGCSCPTG